MTTSNEHTQSHKSAQPRSALFDPWLYLVVFCGGAVGSVLRYALSFVGAHMGAGAAGPTITQGIHVGTLIANILACLIYAALATYLGSAPWIAARKRELTNRAFGMGLCGGLSTMSTLSLEWFTAAQRAGNWSGALVYMALTIVLGLLVAGLGVWLGARLSAAHSSKYQHDAVAGGDRA